MKTLRIEETKPERRDAKVQLISIKGKTAKIKIDEGECIRFIGGGQPARLRSWMFKKGDFPPIFPTLSPEDEAIFEVEKGDVVIADCVRYVIEWDDDGPYLRY